MSGSPDSVLAEACRLVSIPDLAARLGLPPLRVGVQKSPFREDKKGASFSVYDSGRRFRDHARPDHRGNAYNFCRLARPDWTPKDAAEFVIRAAGLDPAAGRPSKADFRRHFAQRRAGMYDARRRQVAEIPPAELLPPWPAEVRERFREGWVALRDSPERQAKLADSRGWPGELVAALVARGLVAAPRLPWSTPGAKGARRGIAFRVDQPRDSGGGRLTLEPVGYHQRFWTDGRKNWLFCPYVPGKPETHYQRQLAELGQRVRPLPFALGELGAPPAGVVITEGQWDAATVFYAAGGFDADGHGGGLVAFGLRGAQGIAPFLSAFGAWLRFHRPPILLLGDGDAAGRAWVDPPRASPTELPPVSFAERLAGLGCRVVSRFIAPHLGKDFSDFYRTRRPVRREVIGWLAGLGILPAPPAAGKPNPLPPTPAAANR